RRRHDVDPDVGGQLELDLALVEFAGAQLAAQFLPRLRFLRRRLRADIDRGLAAEAEARLRRLAARQQRIEDAVFRALLGLGAHLLLGLLAVELDRGVG